jgi:hypothetical protein
MGIAHCVDAAVDQPAVRPPVEDPRALPVVELGEFGGGLLGTAAAAVRLDQAEREDAARRRAGGQVEQLGDPLPVWDSISLSTSAGITPRIPPPSIDSTFNTSAIGASSRRERGPGRRRRCPDGSSSKLRRSRSGVNHVIQTTARRPND